MELRKVAAFFCFFIGLSMIGMWSVFLATGTVPEIETKPAEIGLHVVAEMLTAIMLIVGGLGVLYRKRWSINVYLFASGLLTYTLIVSPGYYVTRGEMAVVVMFAIFLVLDLLILALMLRKGIDGR